MALIPLAVANTSPVFIVAYVFACKALNIVVKFGELEALVAAHFTSAAFGAFEELYVEWFWYCFFGGVPNSAMFVFCNDWQS